MERPRVRSARGVHVAKDGSRAALWGETLWPENTDLQRDLRQVAIRVLTEEPDHLRIACYNIFSHTVVLAMVSTEKKKEQSCFFFFEVRGATSFVKALFLVWSHFNGFCFASCLNNSFGGRGGIVNGLACFCLCVPCVLVSLRLSVLIIRLLVAMHCSLSPAVLLLFDL